MIHKLTLPKILAVELPKDRLADPFSGNLDHRMIDKLLSNNFNGVVGADGRWKLEPAAGWTCEKLDIGKYKVVHNLGYANTCLHVSLLVQPGSFRIESHSPTEFTVETLMDGVPTNLDWMFSLATVISQPDPP